MGSAYGMWTFGVQKGRIEIMSIIVVFHAGFVCVSLLLFSSALKLTHEFWVGVSIVVLGSFICWAATREKLVHRIRLTKRFTSEEFFLRRRIKK